MVSTKTKKDDRVIRMHERTFLAMEKMGQLLKSERAWVRFVVRVQCLFAVLIMTMGGCIIASPHISTHPVAYGVFAGVLLAIGVYLLTAPRPVAFVDWALRCLCSNEESGTEATLAREVCCGCDKYIPFGIYIVNRCDEYHVFAKDEYGELSSVYQSRYKSRCMEFADTLLL